MRTNDKEVAARWGRLLVPFKGHQNMRSSIARGALALLSVAAITGCQSGSTWSPTWWNPFHTTPAPTNSTSAAAPPARPSTLATTSPGSGTASSPYTPYSSSPTAYGTQPNAYGNSGYNTAAASPYSTPAVSNGSGTAYPAGTGYAASGSYSTTPGGMATSPYSNSGYAYGQGSSPVSGGTQYTASNPYGPSSPAVGTYPTTATPYSTPTPSGAAAVHERQLPGAWQRGTQLLKSIRRI